MYMCVVLGQVFVRLNLLYKKMTHLLLISVQETGTRPQVEWQSFSLEILEERD